MRSKKYERKTEDARRTKEEDRSKRWAVGSRNIRNKKQEVKNKKREHTTIINELRRKEEEVRSKK